jgi:hypothetical protein
MNATRLGLFATATLTALLSAACSDGGSSGSGGGGSPVTGPTYHRDVKPIVDVKCNGCHVSGGIAPFALGTYAEVSAQKVAIKAAITAGTMPPWPPADGCSEYLDNRALTKDQIDLISQWVDSGAPEGNPSDKPNTIDPNTTSLSRVDLTVTMPEPYTPQIAPDDYRCFLVDLPSTDTFYITGVGVKPGNASIVHHVIAYLATPDMIADYQAADDAEPGPGYTCFGGPGGDQIKSARRGWIGAWAPGSLGQDFPAGTGIEIPAGSKLVVQVHYNTSTAMPAPDQSSLVFKTDKTVDKKAIMMPWTDPNWVTKHTMDIPAYGKDVVHTFSFDPTPYMGYITDNTIASGVPFTIYSAALHMHTRGTRARSDLVRAGGDKECMLDIEHWNFHWQGSYGFTKPKVFNPGDSMYLECHWDNPTAMPMNWGEGTGDEMCLGAFYATQ